MYLKKKILIITSSCLLISSLSGTIAFATSVDSKEINSTEIESTEAESSEIESSETESTETESAETESAETESSETEIIFYDTDEPSTSSSITFQDETINARAANLNLSAWIKVGGGIGGPGFYQQFTKSGFQKYLQQSYFLNTYYGYVSGFDGKLITLTSGFFNMNNNFYHSDPKTGASSRGLKTINGDTYYFDEDVTNPRAYKGWLEINGVKYFFGDDFKAKKNGFHIINGKTYYFDKDSQLVKAFQVIDEKMYYLATTGEVISGWFSFNTGDRMYFDSAQGGAAYKGWLKSDPLGYIYLHAESGVMQKGVTKIDGETYVFLAKTTGVNINTYRSFGWYTDTSNNNRYYFDKANEGKAVKGTKTIDGKSYTFNSEGVLQK